MSLPALRTAFGFACLCTLGAGALLIFEPRGSAPFWITVWTLIIAIAFLAIVVAAIRLAPRQSPRKGGDA